MLNGLLIDQSTNFVVASPISTPAVSLPAKSGGLPLAQFQLALGQSFSVTYVALHFIRFKTLGFLGKVNTGLPLVYVGLFYPTDLSRNETGARPIWSVGLELPGVTYGRQLNVECTMPGIYSLILVNNAASSAIDVTATGLAQVFNVG